MRIKILMTLLFLVIGPTTVFAFFNDTTHPAITENAIDIYSTGLDSQTKEEARTGSIEEDLPGENQVKAFEVRLVDMRSYNHFLEPYTNRGFHNIQGEWSNAKDFALNSSIQLQWLKDIGRAGDTRYYFQDYSYERAVQLYKVMGKKDEAYRALGHVAHLLQDMGSPPHVWNDAHVLDLWSISSPLVPSIPIGIEYEYEYYVSEKLGSNINQNKGEIIRESDPGKLFTSFAEGTRRDFFSEDHIEVTKEWMDDHNVKKGDIISFKKYLTGTLKGDNIPKEYEGNKFKFARMGLFSRWVPEDLMPLHYILDEEVHKGYWGVLSYKATLYTASLITTFLDNVAVLLPTVDLSADPVNIVQGQCSTLSWSSTNATTVSIDQGVGNVAVSGIRSVCPIVTTIYTITASGSGGTDTKSVLVTVAGSPPTSQYWSKTFGGPDSDYGYSVEKTKDGGYIVTGQKGWSIPSVGAGYHVYLIKTDGEGNTIWEKTYGNTWNDSGNSVQQTSDGGYVIVGHTTYGSGGLGVCIVKTDGNGSITWETTYGGGGGNISGKAIRQTNDGGYIVLAGVQNNGVHLIKINQSGVVLWDKTYGLYSYGRSIELTSDGGFIVAGNEYSAGSDQVYILKTDANGNVVWEKTFGDGYIDGGRSAQQTLDGGYIITGKVFSFVRNGYYMNMIKVDPDGNLLWENTYGDVEALEIRQVADNGYIVVGSTVNSGASGWDCYLMKTNETGNLLWENTFGGSGNDECYSVRQANDGGYVFVGYTSFTGGYTDVYLVKTDENGNTGKWLATGSMGVDRQAHTATLLPNGMVLVAGGYSNSNGGSTLNSAELYDPATGNFSATGVMGTARNGHTATLLPNGKVLVVGGNSGMSYSSVSSAELYNPSTGSITTTGSLNTARSDHTATLLPDGKVLIFGGFNAQFGMWISNPELYDPSTGEFSSIVTNALPRLWHTATPLPNGKVLIAGGWGGYGWVGNYLNSPELYDPASGTFTATGLMASVRSDHTATLLPNGKVLIAGGTYYDNYGYNGRVIPAELYDPDTGMFSATGSIRNPRDRHAATLLSNGKVLIVGGVSLNGLIINSTELYDPATGNFFTAVPMSTTRLNPTATLLGNGKVLVVGGRANSGGNSSAELYIP